MSSWKDIRSKSLGLEEKKFITTDDMSIEDMAKEISRLMKLGIVHFIYKKKDKKTKTGTVIKGEEREAWGTKFMEIVDHVPHGGECPPKAVGYTTYFDCEKAGWRVYWDGRLIGYYDEVYTYSEFERLSKSTDV